MLLFFQIFFIVLSAICVAGTIPIGAWLGWTWVLALVFGAVLFYFLSMLCKSARPQEILQQPLEENFDEKEEKK